MKYRITMDQHAARNANAHRSFHLSFDMIDDQMQKSPPLVGELRLIHMCSQSDGAAAVIFASQDRARSMRRPPVWVQDHITVHREETMAIDGVRTRGADGRDEVTTQRYAAQKLFARNGITGRASRSTSSRCTIRAPWWGLSWLRDFLLLEGTSICRWSSAATSGSKGASPSTRREA